MNPKFVYILIVLFISSCLRSQSWQETPALPFISELRADYGFSISESFKDGVNVHAALEVFGRGEFAVLKFEGTEKELRPLVESFISKKGVKSPVQNVDETFKSYVNNPEIDWWPSHLNLKGSVYSFSPKELNVQLLTVVVIEGDCSIFFFITPKDYYLSHNLK